MNLSELFTTMGGVSHQEALEALAALREVFAPGGDMDAEWNSETTDAAWHAIEGVCFREALAAEQGGYEWRGMVLPPAMLEPLKQYVAHGHAPGDFLTAIIRNDLADACGRADGENARILPAFIGWLYNEAPSTCWGSREKMDAWVESHREIGSD